MTSSFSMRLACDSVTPMRSENSNAVMDVLRPSAVACPDSAGSTSGSAGGSSQVSSRCSGSSSDDEVNGLALDSLGNGSGCDVDCVTTGDGVGSVVGSFGGCGWFWESVSLLSAGVTLSCVFSLASDAK